ncbi:MAG: tetratricopeptide repeat protein [Treponema sp.]|nr:tetratricopeptide repeat protein [Treponema sp.]
MKGIFIFLLSFFFCFGALSCGAREPGEDVIRLYLRSQTSYGEGRFAEAALMLEGENRFVPSLLLRGKSEYFTGDLDAAEKSLNRALRIKPQNVEASFFKARILREKGEKEKSQKLIEEMLSNNPLDIRALRFAAELERDKGPPGEAASAAFLDRAVEASVESAMVFLDRARMRWIGGNHLGALDDLGRARALFNADSPMLRAVEVLESIISEVSM